MDVFVANGHVNPQVDAYSFGVTYAERCLLFHNLGSRGFEEVGTRAGAVLQRKGVYRGSAVADFNNNGELGLVVTQLDGPPLLLRKLAANRLARARQHWLTVKTVGKRSNKDGFGARVDIRAGGLSQTQEIRA